MGVFICVPKNSPDATIGRTVLDVRGDVIDHLVVEITD